MRIKILLVVAFISMISVQLFANGGPMDWSKIKRTGSIVMKQILGVSIQSERIDLKIEGDYSIFDVVYKLKKEDGPSWDSDTVTYGFPVDFYPTYMGDYIFEESYIPYFKMFFQGKELPILEQVDFNEIKTDTTLDYNSYEDYKRKWYISKIVMDKEGVYELRVQYKVKNSYEDDIFSKSIVPVYSRREVRYDMFPASYWGDDAVIDTFCLKVDARNIEDSLKMDYWLVGLDKVGFKNGICEFHKLGLDLNVYHSFYLNYTNGLQAYSNYILKSRMPNDKIKSIKSSGKNEKNQLTNLLDLDFGTSYSSGKPFKSGENWIEFELDSTEVSGLYFLNQDFSKLSNHISKIKIEIWGTNRWMNLDENGNKIEGKEEKIEYVKKLDKHGVKKLNLDNFSDIIDLVVDYGDGGVYAKKIRITILDISGDKNKGFSIPEIIFTDYQWFYKNRQN